MNTLKFNLLLKVEAKDFEMHTLTSKFLVWINRKLLHRNCAFGAPSTDKRDGF